MARPASRRKTPIQKALIEMRRRLKHSQQSMSEFLGIAMQTIARWETSGEPGAPALVMLWNLAKTYKFDDLSAVFEAEIRGMKEDDPRRSDRIQLDLERWTKIMGLLGEIAAIGHQLTAEGHPEGTRLSIFAREVTELSEQACRWAWMNK